MNRNRPTQLEASKQEKPTGGRRRLQDHEALPNGLHADQASDENVCGDANYSSEASFAFEEMLGCLKDLRGRYEIPDKFIEMLRRAQN
ncbi:uncharacterized protein N7473_005625 [Penicillium subrubescens]|uniref:uncharacterized protein n=1 Tax=Penicillium subrubescens TaxID=1316194 RepID=UPI002545A8A7|nr:uncharacterized protein N7473_005625 [Penicillium subrubescens]KAJ5896226.1 hypothetical protein N7473_005625 [Penicillium subrubescens]